ncbi:MAG: prolyl oligopeptidase family serine peptidase [Streptosporangiaceae bacterium]
MTGTSLRSTHDQSGPADPYQWLERADTADVLAWVNEQEATYQAVAAAWRYREPARARIAELTDRIGAVSAPRAMGGRLFLTRLLPGAEQAQLVVVEPGGAVRVLLDPGQLDPGGATTLEGWEPSQDGKLLSYQLATGGTEHSSLFVLDVDSLRLVDGPIDRIRKTTVAWLDGHRGFYYVRRLHPSLIPGEEQYHRRVHFHVLGSDPDADPVIFGAGRDKTQHYIVRISPDGRWLLVSASAGTAPKKDIWIADLTASPPEEPLLRIIQEGYDARSSLLIPARTPPNGVCYLTTDFGAPRGRVVTSTPADPCPGTWKELIREDPDTILKDVAILDGPGLGGRVMLIARTRHSAGEITVHDASDGSVLDRLPVPPHGTIGALRTAPVDAYEAWFTFSTFATPTQVYRFDARSGALERWPVPGLSAAADEAASCQIDIRQVTCHSHDGTPIRIFVITRDGALDRPRPAILTGYGGFGVSMTPSYCPEAIAWAESGGIYAVANIRGGGEEGRDWHAAGMRERKKNVFEDFEAAADCLIDNGWTTPGQLGIWGSSNGGLLAGAALTRHPEKYAAVACVAPLLDMIRYEQSGLGPSWTAEYGSAADPEQHEWLISYSPYHHIRPGVSYPAVMFVVFDGDTRVDPMHARKMCAALQCATGSDQPVLFRLERGTGHGARSVSRRTSLFADLLAFFAAHLGPRES